MNQLKIDISFNHNDAVKISSDFSYDLEELKMKNKVHQIKFFKVEIENKELYEEVKLEVPIKVTVNEKEYNEVLEVDTKCQVKVYKDASENDISKNNLYLGFDERGYFKDGDLEDKLEDFKSKIPDELLENNENLLELDLEGDDLPEDVKRWKDNHFTFKPYLEYDLGNNEFVYIWLNNFGIEMRKKFYFTYNATFYIGNKIEKISEIDLAKIKAFMRMVKNIILSDIELINKNK